jgi:nicotinamidase-related amidase
MGDQLLPFPLTERSVHLCVDMQRIFSAEGAWRRGWTGFCRSRLLSRADIPREPFTRFIPPERPDQMPGMWQRTTRAGALATRECLDLRLLELMPPLAALCPPATVIDKTRYSALAEPKFIEHLRQREAGALIVSGSETDVCVLATVLDAVDLGYRVIVVRDAVCSSSDEGHECVSTTPDIRSMASSAGCVPMA